MLKWAGILTVLSFAVAAAAVAAPPPAVAWGIAYAHRYDRVAHAHGWANRIVSIGCFDLSVMPRTQGPRA